MKRPWIVPVVVAVACCSATLCVRWSGADAIEDLTFDGAMRTLEDPAAPLHRRQVAAGVVLLHMRAAVQALRKIPEVDAYVALRLGQLADMIRAERPR